MARKARTDNIGARRCAECEVFAAVRKNAGGRLYTHCPSCGPKQWNGEAGQDRLMSTIEPGYLWNGRREIPANVPGWIADNRAPGPEPATWADGFGRQSDPVPPVPEPVPEPVTDPVQDPVPPVPENTPEPAKDTDPQPKTEKGSDWLW